MRNGLFRGFLFFLLIGNFFRSVAFYPDTLSNIALFKDVLSRVIKRDSMTRSILLVKSRKDPSIILTCDINMYEKDTIFEVHLYEPYDPYLEGQTPRYLLPSAELYSFKFDSTIYLEYNKTICLTKYKKQIFKNEEDKRISNIVKYSENRLRYNMEIDSVELILNHTFKPDSIVTCAWSIYEGQTTSYRFNNLIYKFWATKAHKPGYALLKNIVRTCQESYDSNE